MNRGQEIADAGYGPNLWANRLKSKLHGYPSVDSPQLETRPRNSRGPYNAVTFMWRGHLYEVVVREVKQ